MVAWWVTLIIVLVTLVFCAILILIARLIKGSGEEPEEEKNKDKCIQVHESKIRLKPTTIVKSVSLSTQEETDVRKNLVDVTSGTHNSVQTHLSKYQLDQFPWWSYMFVVVGGFVVCMFLNYVVNRVNAARFERYEQLHHANDPDKPSEHNLKMPIDCPKKTKTNGEVKEITLVFTQDENRRRSKETKCLEHILVKPTTSGYSLLSCVGNTQMINQTTRKPIQIKDSLLLGSVTEKIFERELIDHSVETEPVDLDFESEPGDGDVERELVCNTLERKPVQETIATHLVHLNVEREPVCKIFEIDPVHPTIARQPVHLNVERESVCKIIESDPVHPTIERQPVHQTNERQPVHQTNERQPVYQTNERQPVHLPIEREPVHQTVESEPVHLSIERETVHQTVDSEPVPLPIEREPVHQTVENEPVYQTVESGLVYLPIEREPIHQIVENEIVHQTVESEPVHQTVESEPVHLPIEREPVNVLVHEVEIKKFKISASTPTLSHSEIINEGITDVRHYASDVSLSSCNEKKAENKHG